MSLCVSLLCCACPRVGARAMQVCECSVCTLCSLTLFSRSCSRTSRGKEGEKDRKDTKRRVLLTFAGTFQLFSLQCFSVEPRVALLCPTAAAHAHSFLCALQRARSLGQAAFHALSSLSSLLFCAKGKATTLFFLLCIWLASPNALGERACFSRTTETDTHLPFLTLSRSAHLSSQLPALLQTVSSPCIACLFGFEPPLPRLSNKRWLLADVSFIQHPHPASIPS